MRVIADRTYKFRDRILPNSRIRSIITVATTEVEEFLSKSGQYGILYEHPDRHSNSRMAKINLPLEWDLNDAIREVAKLEATLRKKVLGIVPTSRGFAARVRPDDKAEVTTVLCPELAEQLGPSLGLQPNSSWLVRNLPRRINKQDLSRILASEAGPWSAWHVLPRYTANDNRPGGSTWVVEAEEPPPRRAFKARSTCVTIERYTDERSLSLACKVWAKPIAQWEAAATRASAARATRKPWSDMADDDIDVDS